MSAPRDILLVIREGHKATIDMFLARDRKRRTAKRHRELSRQGKALERVLAMFPEAKQSKR